jgi:hypothetical protein
MHFICEFHSVSYNMLIRIPFAWHLKENCPNYCLVPQ